MRKIITVLIFLFTFISCQKSHHQRVLRITESWLGKEILFPTHSVFMVNARDTVNFSFEKAEHKILSYVDTLGCISCKLQLNQWEKWMQELEDKNLQIPVLFYIHAKSKRDFRGAILKDAFPYPVCYDEHDSLNKMNHFPDNMAFQTFLLDKENKVVALGNPIHNPRVKELYLDIIQGKQQLEDKAAITVVEVPETTLSLGSFPWEEEQKASFTLKNVGEQPLHIEGVTTSCDCTTVEYAKAPVPPGATLTLLVKYKAEKPEPFYRTITIYCNTPNAPLELEITGEGK